MTILSQIPVWVYPLFILLLLLGMRARRERHVPVWLVYMLPLIGLLTLRSLAAMPNPGLAWPVAAVCFFIGIRVGKSAQAGFLIARQGNRLHLRGENLTLITVMGLFCLNFAGGMARGIAPDLAGSVEFVVIMAGLLGGLAGLFPGRALYTLNAA